MTVRLRFVYSFLAGIIVSLVVTVIFLLVGVVTFNESASSAQLLLGIGLLIVVLGIALFGLIRMLKRFDRPVKQLVKGVEQISNGNLSPDLPNDVPAEFGVIKDALVTMCEQMRMILSQLTTLSGHVVESTSEADVSFTKVEDGVKSQSKTAARTFRTVQQLSKGLLNASEKIESIAGRIDDSVSRVAKMDMAVVLVTKTIGELNASIDKASVTIAAGDQGAQTLSKDIGGLSTSIKMAHGSLRDMMGGSQKARSDAGDAALIIENLESEAERIGKAIEDVLKGSDTAHASNERILEVTANLESRVDRVDDVLEVTHNLAERTKLLSINASIIASEAGEHGRAFAVVAREVKDLAQSTAGAIAEISEVVVGLKEGFAQTVETIQRGQEEVDQGVRLARNAVVLLGSIPDEVQKAAACNAEIVAQTDKQVEKGEQIERIINRIGGTLDQVNVVLTEQVSRNDQSLTLFQNISSSMEQLLGSVHNHASVSQDLNRTVDTISGDFHSMSGQVREHVSTLGHVVDMSEEAMAITDTNLKRTEALSLLISDLARYALYLGEDFRKLGTEELS